MVDSRRELIRARGGNSLMTNRTKAEGTDEPGHQTNRYQENPTGLSNRAVSILDIQDCNGMGKLETVPMK